MGDAYRYGTEPFDHQRRLFEATRGLAGHAVLWEQGCGKTKPMIDTGCYLYECGEIDAILVVAPPGVERNWVTDEMPLHMPERHWERCRYMVWRTKSATAKWHASEFRDLLAHDGLAVLCVTYSGFMTAAGKDAVWRFLRRRRVLYILDESDAIKTPAAKRTRSIIASGKYARHRRIMTGTPADKPFDIYSQLRFVDPDLWARQGMSSFAAFKRYFGVWWTREEMAEALGRPVGQCYDKLVEYRNLDELAETLAGVSDRLLKADVLDLPPKLYTKWRFEMTPRQRSLYEELSETLELELSDGRLMEAELPIVRLLRLQQIACGYLATDADEPVEACDKSNPRLDATVEGLERLHHPAIVWARFRHDIDQLVDALGDRAVRYDGSVDDDERERAKRAFVAGDVQFFVGNPETGGRGLTMNVAKTVVYYSNSFKLLTRLQSEDRCHRYGQDGADHGEAGHGVLYADLMAEGTVDDKIVAALRSKFDIASRLTGDRLRDWI